MRSRKQTVHSISETEENSRLNVHNTHTHAHFFCCCASEILIVGIYLRLLPVIIRGGCEVR